MKKGILVVALLAVTASAAFLGRHAVREALETRGMLARKSISSASSLLASTVRPAPAASFTVHGEVVGSNAMSGTLTLRVGSQISAIPITVLPGYSFTIAGAQASDMVSIEIETATYRYASLLGSYAKLARHAGADRVLTIAELDRSRLSAFSTSLYFFVQRELGGRLPVSDSEHEQVIRSVFNEDLGTATAALEDLTNGSATLPQGYANGYALLQDQEGYRTFLSQYGHRHTDELMTAPTTAIRPARLGTNTLLLGAIPRNDVPMFNSGGVRILTQTSQGWASHTSQSRRNALFTAQVLPSGELELTPRGQLSSDVLVVKQVDPSQQNAQVNERRTILREVYRQVFAGDRYSLWAVRTDWLATYPDYPFAPSAPGSATSMSTAMMLDGLLPFRDGELLGERALPVFCKQGSPLQLQSCDFAPQRFSANGSGSTSKVGPKIDTNMQPVSATGGALFLWSNGRKGPLELTYYDTSVTYWRIDQGDAATDVLVYIARAQDGADTLTSAGQTTLINADLSGDFAGFGPVGTWRYGTFEQPKIPYGDPSYPVMTRFLRNADGTTVKSDTWIDDPIAGPMNYNYRSGWQLIGDLLYDTRYRANVSTGITNTMYFSSCVSAYARGASQCAPIQVRYFQPLARVGNRLYGIQDVYTQTPLSYTPPFATVHGAQANYIEKL